MTRKEVIKKSLEYYIFDCNYKYYGRQKEDEITHAKGLLKQLETVEPSNNWLCSNFTLLDRALKQERQYIKRCEIEQEPDTDMDEIREEKQILFQLLGIINDFREKLLGSVNIDI